MAGIYYPSTANVFNFKAQPENLNKINYLTTPQIKFVEFIKNKSNYINN